LNWKDAHSSIEKNITIGTYLGNIDYHNILIIDIYRDGFEIKIGSGKSFNLRWFILEHCWKAMNAKQVFNELVFKEIFDDGCFDNPHLVHIVGQVFVKAGLARSHEQIYRIFDDKQNKQLKLQISTPTFYCI
jgi:hypothetical protein